MVGDVMARGLGAPRSSRNLTKGHMHRRLDAKSLAKLVRKESNDEAGLVLVRRTSKSLRRISSRLEGFVAPASVAYR